MAEVNILDTFKNKRPSPPPAEEKEKVKLRYYPSSKQNLEVIRKKTTTTNPPSLSAEQSDYSVVRRTSSPTREETVTPQLASSSENSAVSGRSKHQQAFFQKKPSGVSASQEPKTAPKLSPIPENIPKIPRNKEQNISNQPSLPFGEEENGMSIPLLLEEQLDRNWAEEISWMPGYEVDVEAEQEYPVSIEEETQALSLEPGLPQEPSVFHDQQEPRQTARPSKKSAKQTNQPKAIAETPSQLAKHRSYQEWKRRGSSAWEGLRESFVGHLTGRITEWGLLALLLLNGFMLFRQGNLMNEFEQLLQAQNTFFSRYTKKLENSLVLDSDLLQNNDYWEETGDFDDQAATDALRDYQRIPSLPANKQRIFDDLPADFRDQKLRVQQ